MTRQDGQSLTEFAVGMAVMVLMLLGSITIASYQELQRRTAIAAKQASFQGAGRAGAMAIPKYCEMLRNINWKIRP